MSLQWNEVMKVGDLKIPFDKFASEALWALSSLRAFLFDEYRANPDLEKLPKIIASLILQFDRHMASAEASGKINIVKYTRTAFAAIEEPLFQDMKAFIANEGKMPESVKKHSKPSNNLNSWNKVLFCALPRGLETRVKGKIFSEQELIEKGLTKGNIAFLHKISIKGGFIDKNVFLEITNLSQSVKRLNDSLREAFQLKEDPVIYNKKAKGFKALFKTETDFTE